MVKSFDVFQETLSTCRFSQRVALVTNDALLNEEVDAELLIAQLKAENRRLKMAMANSTVRGVSQPSPNHLLCGLTHTPPHYRSVRTRTL